MRVMRITTHPGDILKRELKARRVSQKEFALALGIPSGRVAEILNRKSRVTADIAGRLSRYLGTSAQIWMNMQARYDRSVAESGLRKKSRSR
jgi:addiction module HigA family antidote